MIVFDKLWKTMEEKGVTTYSLREKCSNFNASERFFVAASGSSE